MLRRFDSPLYAVVLVAVLVGLFVFGKLSRFNFDPSFFVVAGDYYSDPAKVPTGLTVLPNGPGYDGQFYYRLGLDPFSFKETDYGMTLDNPAYRQQRILYPLLGSILSGGNPKLLPFAMILVNVVALCALAWIGANFARAFSVHALWGAFLPLQPAFLFSLARNLVEILEVSLLLGSLLLLRRGRPVVATVLLGLAVVTRETALLVALVALLTYVWQAWRKESEKMIRWYYFAVPIAVSILWRGFISHQWGSSAAYSAGKNLLTLPFAGAGSFFLEMATLETGWHGWMFTELVFLLVFAAGVFLSLRAAKASLLEKLVCLSYATLAVCLSRDVWCEDWAFFRATAQFCGVGTIILLAGDLKMRASIFACSSFLWFLLFDRLRHHA